MKKATLLSVMLFCVQFFNAQNPVTNGPDWTVTNLTADNELEYPNTIIYGPDNNLWITERIGKKVVKVSTAGGTKTTMLDLSSEVYQSAGQDGLMGMAIHPDLYADLNTTTNNYVYLAYTYDLPGGGVNRLLRIERYTYNSGTGNLNSGSATTILEGMEASNDHNSGKLQIGPDLKLYYTIGDQGANQFVNACNEIRSQYLPTTDGQTPTTGDKSEYKGKILRMELDGSIPTDNPILGGFRTHVYTLGHRNPQGIVFGSNGKLYSSEHGPKVDDELNIIEAGKNYGWPEIAGYYDDNGYGYCNWSSTPGGCSSSGFSDHNCPSGVSKVPESTSGMPVNFQEPIGTYNSTTSPEPTGSWLTWPTVGPSSIDIYEGGEIPGWGTSLLIPTLKRGTIFRTQLNTAGDALEDGTYEEFHSSNDRYRDICFDPDGVTIYAVTDNTGGTSGPSGTSNVSIENPGVIVKIQFIGTTLSSNSLAEHINFNVIPNPAKSSFKINYYQKNNDLINVSIIDIQGRIVKNLNNININSNISTSELFDGVYFVKIQNHDGEVGTKKLIIKK